MSKFLEAFLSATKALSSNKVRSFLTILGVVVGVFSVVTLVSLVKGVENYVRDQFENLGSNLLFVAPGRAGIAGDPALSFTDNKIREEHVRLIESGAADYIDVVSPLIFVGKTVEYKNRKFFSTISGVYSVYDRVENLAMSKGRFFSTSEDKSGARVIVLGPAVAKELFSQRDPLGEKVIIDSKKYKVIGVTRERGADFDELVYIPFNAVKDSIGVESISYITAKVKPNVDMDIASKQLEVALLADLDKEDFSIMSQKDILRSIEDILNILTLGLAAVAGISLLVGGIGIMNIMLVSVTERIKEIGLRKAVGATSFVIGFQFIIESMLLSLGGGVIGLFLGWIASQVASKFIRTEVPLWAVFVSLGFSVFVGAVFGTYPAIQASKKDPIESLRWE